MTDIQAAIGLVQLGRLGEIVMRRRERAARYRSLLADVPGMRLVDDPPYGFGTYQACWALLDGDYALRRDELLAFLMTRGVRRAAGSWRHISNRRTWAPRTSSCRTPSASRCDSLILPLYHVMTDAEQDEVVEAIKSASRRAAPPGSLID